MNYKEYNEISPLDKLSESEATGATINFCTVFTVLGIYIVYWLC